MENTGIDLSKHEKRVFSQNGEDGVLSTILEIVGIQTGFFVECGAGDGQECNTRFLRTHRGFSGVIFDKNHEDPANKLFRKTFTRENVLGIFERFEIPREFDVLSIDVDGIDFYLWQEISTSYRPRIVIIEYNATHLPGEDRVVVYDPDFSWDYTNYFGASLSALYSLGRSRGYSLVYAESMGVNLFFVRDDVVEQSGTSFADINLPEKLYRPPRYGYGPNGGHAEDIKFRPYISSAAAMGSRVF